MIKKHLTYFSVFILILAASAFAQDLATGIKLIRNEKLDDAKKFFMSMLNGGSKAEANFYLGQIYMIQEKPDSAKIFYQKGIEANSDYPLNYAGLVKINILNGNSADAEKNSNQAIDIGDEKNPDVYIVLSEAYSRIKNYDKAIELLNKAIKINPQYAPAYLALGKVYLSRSDGTNAIKNFQSAIDNDKTNPEAYTLKAKVYILINNYNDAINLLNEAITNDSTYGPAYNELAELYANQKDYPKAAEYYTKYMQTSQPTVEKQKRFAQILYLSKDYQKATDVLKEVLKVQPDNTTVNRILAYSYLRLNDTQNSMVYFQKLFEIPNGEFSADDYQIYADLLSQTSNDSLAIINYKKAISLDSTNAELHAKLAALDFKNKKYPEAINEYFLEEKLSGKKLSLREYFDLGTALTVNKDYAKADSVFGEITKMKPDLPLGYLMRARVQSTIDSTQELGYAKPYYEKFIEVATSSPDSAKYQKDLIEAYSYLGYHYFLKKDDPEYRSTWRENYKENWEKVLALDPENQQAKDALEGLKKIK